MEQYTASNGLIIKRELSGFTYTDPDPAEGYTDGLYENAVEALREFFRAEEDERLGRWRWPENPDYVVYPDGTSRRVVRESDGQSMSVSLHDRKVMTTYLDSYVSAARAFDAAHPEPKPWHDAKPGDHWALHIASGVTLSDEFHLFKVTRWMDRDGWYFVPTDGGSVFALNDSAITAGRRIWPEES